MTRTVTKLRQDAKGDRAVEAELLEGFNDLMGWRSPETMATYLKTMNKRQAIANLLEDEKAQSQVENCVLAPSAPAAGQSEPASSQKRAFQVEAPSLLSGSNADEFAWYEDEE